MTRFPAKTFLLGEYAVLEGGKALLLGHGPFFEASLVPGESRHPFHPASAAGAWATTHPPPGELRFRDPFAGKGGFGASGAEFLALWSLSQDIPAPGLPRSIFCWNAWEDSRGLPGAGSGADILVQAYGANRTHSFLLSVDIAGRTLAEREPAGGATLSLFHTGRKLATHEQRTPGDLPLATLNGIVESAESFLADGLIDGFARELSRYGEALRKLGLLAPHSASALDELGALPGLMAAKGCGAMGADVLAVLHRGAELASWARQNSLSPCGDFPL